jgi:hypothetical protein
MLRRSVDRGGVRSRAGLLVADDRRRVTLTGFKHPASGVVVEHWSNAD